MLKSSFAILTILISYVAYMVNGSAIWLFWDKGLEHALSDPFKEACYDSIVRAAQVAGLPVIVGDKNFGDWLVDKEDIDFNVFYYLQAAQKHQAEVAKKRAEEEIKKLNREEPDKRKREKAIEEATKIKEKAIKEANRNFAVLADAWRLSIIYKYGGIYLDFSTYIADPQYFKRVWEQKVAAKTDAPNQFYGYKAYRKDIGDGGDEPYEYQVWLLAAPRLSNFIGLWKQLVIGKLMINRDVAKVGFQGVEGMFLMFICGTVQNCMPLVTFKTDQKYV